MKEQGHATAGGEEVGGDRGTREEEPASRAPPPGPDLQDHSEPPQPNPQPERDAQRQEKREHSAGEGRIPESEGEGEFITQKKKKKIKNINEINSPESEGKAEQGSETLETQAGTVGDPAQPDSQPQQQQQPPPTAEERADAGLEEDETSCGGGGDLDEGDISDSSLFSDIPDSQTVRRSIVYPLKMINDFLDKTKGKRGVDVATFFSDLRSFIQSTELALKKATVKELDMPKRYRLKKIGFDQFRSDETLCDVVLVSGEGSESFPVHRVLMASSSDYFKAMFTGGMKEQELKTIKLQGLSCVGLKNIIDFIYTAKVALNMDNLQDTLEAASFLQIMPVLDFCKELLISEVTTDNCVEVGRIASIYHLTEVSSFINEFVLRNFSVLLKEGQYLQLSEDSMAHALASDNLKNCTEMELFKHTCDWLKHDESRKAHTYKLMKNIRFPLMTPSELLQISDEADFLRVEAACVNLLLEASNYQMMPYMQPIMQTERTHIRSDANHLVTLGGVLRQQLVVSKELRLFDEDTKNWKALKPMDVPRYQHGIAVIGNFLYIVGGQSNYDTKGKTAVDSVYRYDPRFNRWLQVASLNEKRTFFHLSALKGKLYAVGGRNTTGEIASVECYNLRNNEWTCVAPISEPHYGHAGTVHGELMYISGGITHDTFQKELTCYDPDTNTWSRKADMSTLRGLHCMCTIEDRLYVIGGNHFRGTNDYDDVLSCEYYCPGTDQWTVIAPMLSGQSDVGVAVFKSKIYVIGGYSWNSRCMVEIVQCYDPEKDEWEKVFDVLEPLGGIRACSLIVHPPEDTVESQTQECPLSTKS
ncbi:UNVERIFIED_CONTAM: hypothetical protein FKN15_053486 [Acipenser sinensis]